MQRPLIGSIQQGQWHSSPAGLRLVEQVRRGAMSHHTHSMYDPPHPGLVLELCFDETFTVELAAAQMGVAPQVLHVQSRRQLR